MNDVKLIKGILYTRKKVKGISCNGCTFENPNDKTCKINMSVFDKCVDEDNYNRYEESYIITGIAFYTKLKII